MLSNTKTFSGDVVEDALRALLFNPKKISGDVVEDAAVQSTQKSFQDRDRDGKRTDNSWTTGQRDFSREILLLMIINLKTYL